jgi:hypothetical protein
MAMARARESLTEMLRSHEDWLKWLDLANEREDTVSLLSRRDPNGRIDQSNGSGSRPLNESSLDLLAPRLGAVQLKKFTPTKERLVRLFLRYINFGARRKI